jgi:cytochrome c peroxidase
VQRSTRLAAWRHGIAAFAFAFGASAIGCASSGEAVDARDHASPSHETTATAEDPVEPLRLLDLDPKRVKLGERLFRDPRVSGDGSVSCESCHLREEGGADGRVHPMLGTRSEGTVNTPSIYNLAYDHRYNWSARFDDLGPQLDANLRNPLTMASNWPHVGRVVAADAGYVHDFATAYPGGATAENARDALVVYQLSLVTPSSRFDRWLDGEQGAITAIEKSGYALFKRYGCISCHQGKNLGGNMVERLGVMRDYFAYRGHVTDADLGRFAVTHDERDRYVFRVPSLRNVERTAPYFHDGSAATLEDAVDVMARYQLGRPLEGDDAERIVAFLKTLTGTLHGAPL